jgi:hypothetical protein
MFMLEVRIMRRVDGVTGRSAARVEFAERSRPSD